MGCGIGWGKPCPGPYTAVPTATPVGCIGGGGVPYTAWPTATPPDDCIGCPYTGWALSAVWMVQAPALSANAMRA